MPSAPDTRFGAQSLANADHTTLLLNCYTKLKDVSKLDAFLRGAGAADGQGALPFDVETAVKVRPLSLFKASYVEMCLCRGLCESACPSKPLHVYHNQQT